MFSKAMQQAAALMDQGRGHLDAGRKEEAEACFRAAAQLDPGPHALNNWAVCRYLQKDYRGTLRILEPIRSTSDPLPYTHALASLALTALGQRDEARRVLQRAIDDLDRGLALRQGAGLTDPAWVEYTILIKQAAGALGEHRLLLDLHNRWPGRDLPLGAYCAGAAAFNLSKFGQAARLWGRIHHPAWRRLMEAFSRVAALADQGLIPPFPLEYDLAYDPEEANQGLEAARALTARGTVRMRFLAMMFDREAPDAATTTALLIGSTGPWGIELARRLLAGSTVDMRLKMGAAEALIEAGVFRPDQPIPIVHQGRPGEIRVQKVAVRDPQDPELAGVVAEARRLHGAGKTEEALRLLSDLHRKGIAHPPAMLLQAGLLMERGELDAAQALLESLEQIAPDHPSVLLNLASIWLQRGNLERARRYAGAIDPGRTSPDFQRHLARLKAAIDQSARFAGLPDPAAVMDAMREEAEEKPLSPSVTLAAALRQIPVQWLNATAALYQVAPARRRPEREKAVAAALRNPAMVRRALAAEGPQVRAALAHLLEKGGWAKLQVMTRRFGTLEGDGFFWDEQPPASTIGRLRLLGLVFVGRARIDGRNHKIAVVPEELRPLLAEALQRL